MGASSPQFLANQLAPPKTGGGGPDYAQHTFLTVPHPPILDRPATQEIVSYGNEGASLLSPEIPLVSVPIPDNDPITHIFHFEYQFLFEL